MYPYSSYPTYEEWKLPKNLKPDRFLECSYPTYEEWKQFNIFPASVPFRGSYPTYEEWKRNLYGDATKTASVLILPMRNGNVVRFILALQQF